MSNFITNVTFLLQEENISFDKIGNLLRIKKIDLEPYFQGEKEFSNFEKAQIAAFLKVDLDTLEKDVFNTERKIIEREVWQFPRVSYWSLLILIAMVLLWIFSPSFSYILIIAVALIIVAFFLLLWGKKPQKVRLLEMETTYLERNEQNNIGAVVSLFWLLCLILLTLFYFPQVSAILALLCFGLSFGVIGYYLWFSFFERIERIGVMLKLFFLLPFLLVNLGVGLLIANVTLEFWLLLVLIGIDLFLNLETLAIIHNLSKYKIIIVNERTLAKRYLN